MPSHEHGARGPTGGIAYLIPVVALALGVVLRDEHVEAIAVAGLGLRSSAPG